MGLTFRLYGGVDLYIPSAIAMHGDDILKRRGPGVVSNPAIPRRIRPLCDFCASQPARSEGCAGGLY
jgi:hypothetical protein